MVLSNKTVMCRNYCNRVFDKEKSYVNTFPDQRFLVKLQNVGENVYVTS